MVTLATLYNDFKTLIKQNFYDKTETDTLVNAKQDTLVSGTNIKTINNNSLLGSGNISISASGTVDSALDTTSTNPVQNQAIATEINSLNNSITNLVQIQYIESGVKSINNGANVSVQHTVTACPTGYSWLWVQKESFRATQTDIYLNGTTLSYKMYNHSGSNSTACYVKGWLVFYPSTWNI